MISSLSTHGAALAKVVVLVKLGRRRGSGHDLGQARLSIPPNLKFTCITRWWKMTLKEEFEKTGNWLFRWRSYLPLIMVGLFLIALRDFQYPYDSHALYELWAIFCLTIALLGLVIRIFTVGYVPSGTSGRNTKAQVADFLNTTGMYSIVRNPLYLGNLFIWLGISLFIRSWWLSLIVVLLFCLYYERIMFAEEQFLGEKFGEEFYEWAKKTPAIFPNFRNWQRANATFSFKTALKREYSTLFAIIVSFTSFEIAGEIFINGRFHLDTIWIIIFSISLIIYLFIRIIKKRTTILDIEGR